MNILVGTTNRNKVRSVQRYLQAYDVQLVYICSFPKHRK